MLMTNEYLKYLIRKLTFRLVCSNFEFFNCSPMGAPPIRLIMSDSWNNSYVNDKNIGNIDNNNWIVILIMLVVTLGHL